MLKKINLFFSWSLWVLLLLPANLAKAIDNPLNRFKKIADKSGYITDSANSKITIMADIIIYALGLVGLFFLIMVLYSGFQWISAGGNEEIITKAKTRLKNSIIGFAVIVAAYALTVLIVNMLGASVSDVYL